MDQTEDERLGFIATIPEGGLHVHLRASVVRDGKVTTEVGALILTHAEFAAFRQSVPTIIKETTIPRPSSGAE